MAEKEQSWKTKHQQLDMTNKDIVEQIQMREARIQELTQRHKITDETVGQLVLQELTNQATHSKIRVEELEVTNEEFTNKAAQLQA